MFLYHFFDYKGNIPNFSSDLFSVPHFIYIFLVVIIGPLICFLSRNVSHKKLDIYFKILSIIMIILEITKISWETYYDLKAGLGFNAYGLLPLYTCSLFIYTLFIAAWFKGIVRDYSLSFLTTIGLASGLIGVIYCNGLNWYPFWTFGAFYSLIFHSTMFITGLLMLTTRYKKLEARDIYRGWIPMVVLALIAIPINYIYDSDYMQIHYGSSVPLLEDLGRIMIDHNLRPLFILIALASYMILSSVIYGCYYSIRFVINKKEKKV